ncbi:MAG: tetratricopeptide repeat protein [bacterium]
MRTTVQFFFIAFLLTSSSLLLAQTPERSSVFNKDNSPWPTDEFSGPADIVNRYIHFGSRSLLDELEMRGSSEKTSAMYQLGSLEAYHRRELIASQNALHEIIEHETSSSLHYSEAKLLAALELLSEQNIDAKKRSAIEENLLKIDTVSFVGNNFVAAEYFYWLAEIRRYNRDISASANSYQSAIARLSAILHYDDSITHHRSSSLKSLSQYRLAELYEYELRFIKACELYDTVASNPSSKLRIFSSLKRASLLRSIGDYHSSLKELSRTDELFGLQINTLVSPSERTLQYESSFSYSRSLSGDSVLYCSQYTLAQIFLLKGSAYSNLKEFDSAKKFLLLAQESLNRSVDSLKQASEYRFLRHGITFERGWMALGNGANDSAATLFSELASEDTSSHSNSLSSNSEISDGASFFHERKNEKASGTFAATTSYIYDDYPERARFYLGIALSRAGKVDAARDVLTNLSLDPSALYSDKAKYHLALVEFRSGRSIQAEALLSQIVLHRSLSGVFASVLLGDIHYRRSSFAKASEYFAFALANLPEHDTVLRSVCALERGLSLLPLGSWAESAENLKLYVALTTAKSDGLDEALFWLGRAYFRADSMPQARNCFRRILTEFPETDRKIDAQYGYAWTLFMNGEYVNADKEFTKVIEIDAITKYAYDALSRRGDAFYALGDIKNSLAVYNLAIDRPTFNEYRTTRSLFQTGVLRMLSDSGRSAMNLFRTIYTKYPKSNIIDRTYYNYSVAAYSLQKDDEANEALRILTTKFKDSPFAPKGYFLGAYQDQKKGNYRTAYTRYKKIIQDYPNADEFVPSIFGAINVLSRQKKNAEAIALCDTFLLKNPHASFAPRLLYQKGEIQFTSNDLQGAAKTFTRFTDEFPADTLLPWAKFMYAKTQLGTCENCTEAKDLLSELTTKYANQDVASFAYLELAKLQVRLDETDEAATNFTKAFAMEYYSSEAAPKAMYEYARYLTSERRLSDSAVHVYDDLVNRYNEETKIGGNAMLEASTVLLSTGKRSGAISHLEKLASAQEGYELAAEARLRMAKLFFSDGATKKALTEFERARNDNSTRPEQLGKSYIGSVECQIAMGNKKKAKLLLGEVLANREIPKSYRVKAKEILQSLTQKKTRRRR